MRRRQFLLEAAAAGVTGFAVSGRTAEVSSVLAPPALTVTRLSSNMAVISGAGGNVTALWGVEGILLVDCGTAAGWPQLRQVLSALAGGQQVRTVFNTHWHPDHTGSNDQVIKAGASVIAHENTRLWMGSQVREQWQDRIYPPRSRSAWPTQTFYYKTGHMTFGGEQIDYGYLPQAHTDGDLYVHFRNQNVLAAGDVVSVGSYPILDYCTGGWIGGMENATQKLLTVADAATRVVPGTGPVQTKADLEAEHEMLSSVHATLWKMMCQSLSASDMIAARATAQFDSRWGKPDLFVANAYQGMYGHVAEYLGKGVV